MVDGQGGSRATRDPGLKPWAVLYSRFAAKSDSPLRDENPGAPRLTHMAAAGSTRPHDVFRRKASFDPVAAGPPPSLPNGPPWVDAHSSGPFRRDEISQLCSERVTQCLLKRSSLRNCRGMQFVLTVWTTGK